jgi:hypothetical protein
MAKSKRTRTRWHHAFVDQTHLNSFSTFSLPSSETGHCPSQSKYKPCARSTSILSDPSDHDRSDLEDAIQLSTISETTPPNSEPVSEAETHEGDTVDEDDSHLPVEIEDPADGEAWKEELEEMTHGRVADVEDWSTLCERVNDTLKKKHKTLSLSDLNQFIILSNIFTLLIKNISWLWLSSAVYYWEVCSPLIGAKMHKSM